ncbi:MAG: hypothetical protein JST21_18770 [Bacteroidetes bacterium]|nr:hypothetical protein [Bacteroidota bacterium]MBS1748208.1 hypothetical protein [Bacteroidota bacterium]
MKTLRNKLLIAVSLSVWMMLTACPAKERRHDKVPEEVIAFFDYQVGSYWVMKDSATGVLDSFYVTTYYVDKSSYWENTSVYILRENANAYLSVDLDPASVRLGSGFTNSNIGVSYDLAINYPFWLGKHDSYNAQYEMFFYPKLTINGSSEDSVYVACGNSNSPGNSYSDTISFNRSKGLLQMNFNNTLEKHNWILQRQKIIK